MTFDAFGTLKKRKKRTSLSCDFYYYLERRMHYSFLSNALVCEEICIRFWRKQHIQGFWTKMWINGRAVSRATFGTIGLFLSIWTESKETKSQVKTSKRNEVGLISFTSTQNTVRLPVLLLPQRNNVSVLWIYYRSFIYLWQLDTNKSTPATRSLFKFCCCQERSLHFLC